MFSVFKIALAVVAFMVALTALVFGVGLLTNIIFYGG